MLLWFPGFLRSACTMVRLSIILSSSLVSTALASGEATESPIHRSFLAVGVGLSESVTSDESGIVIGARLGQHVSRSLQITEAVQGLFGLGDRTSRNVVHNLAFVTVGIRWAPFSVSRFGASRFYPNKYIDLSAFYVSGSFGIGVRDTISFSSNDRMVESSYGVGFTPALGWLPMQGDDHAWGVEASFLGTRVRAETDVRWSISLVVQGAR